MSASRDPNAFCHVGPERFGAPLSAGIPSSMNRNTLYVLVGALIVIVIGLGAYAYNEQTKPKGVEIKLDETGVSIQEN
jgi:hypothetical protein